MFWVLERPLEVNTNTISGTLNIDPKFKIWETQTCESCHRTRIIQQINDITIDIYGETLQNFVWIDDAQIIVDDMLSKLIQEADLDGLRFREVHIGAWYQIDPNANEFINTLNKSVPPKLFQLDVYGSGGSLLATNGANVKETCRVCGLTVFEPPRGIVVDETQWEGSDIFTMKEFPGIFLITDKFAQLLESYNIQNYRLIDSTNYR